jgi:hypothetical protein
MKTIARQLTILINDAYPHLKSLPESRASEKPYPEKWSIKEILGHLIDSAANNHQRIVRMQEVEHIGTFKYSQEHWVSSQNYQSESWQDIVELWYRYNVHLSHVIAQIDPESLSHTCDVGHPEPITLTSMIESYVRHVEHHLAQIFSNDDPRERKKWK